MFANLAANPDMPLDEAQLLAVVRQALATAPERDVLVKADTRVEYGRVIGAMVVLQQGGASRIGFLTDPLPEPVGRRP
jgi:biopolymer transport protein TolR